AYLTEVVGGVSQIPRFQVNNLKIGRSSVGWQDILSWWIAPSQAAKRPTPNQLYRWHRFVSDAFAYRFAWVLGSVLSIATYEVHSGELWPTRLEEWPRTGLPWVVFWVKELVVWGTVDPVAAYLLARSQAETRPNAEALAREYYSQANASISPNDLL